MKKIVLILMIGLLLNGCSKTINRWSNTVPKEYLEVYGKEDLPLKLKAKQVEHKCVDLVYSSEGYTKKCYVEKNSAEQIEGWRARLYETSKMALLDTGENVMILGMMVLCGMGGDCRNLDVGKIKMKNYKKIVLSLTLLTLPMIHGCDNEETSPEKPYTRTSQDIKDEQRIAEKNSKIEAEIYSELKKTDGTSYRSILAEATSDEEIVDYDNVNLLSVKIVSDVYTYKIKLFYDESLLKVEVLENFLHPAHNTAYHIAEKNKIINPEVETYVNNKLLREF